MNKVEGRNNIFISPFLPSISPFLLYFFHALTQIRLKQCPQFPFLPLTLLPSKSPFLLYFFHFTSLTFIHSIFSPLFHSPPLPLVPLFPFPSSNPYSFHFSSSYISSISLFLLHFFHFSSLPSIHSISLSLFFSSPLPLLLHSLSVKLELYLTLHFHIPVS